MALKNMIEAGKLVEINGNYLTDDGVVIMECASRTGATTYWVRNDDIYTAYAHVDDAYDEYHGRDIRRQMRRATALSIIACIKGHVARGVEIIEK